ncbi:RIO1 family regulatory kinase/ATPase [Halolamina sp.]|jgi:serine/threonine protein kinase|uniref:RIO1 family regulatory kinase/ATPase domain-containing protein n=1 Tax=Halolamina sp. TaxID=1940283 RepID=UPI000223B528|nr:aminoglycoside phosphotransferase [halophilic archaeon DL31]
MELRKLVRGQVEWPRLESIVRELAQRYGCEEVHVRFLEADNWLSTPMVLDDKYFVKVVTEQNSFVHALFTTTRNLGAFSSGTEGFFGHFGDPYEMAQHELEATNRLREIGLNAPEPVEALEIDGLGVLVMEFIPEFVTLDQMSEADERERAPDMFEALHAMHDNGLAHGDLRAENVLVVDGEIYFIDATSIRADENSPDASMASAQSYDLACALAALEPLIGAREAVGAAASAYTTDELLAAREFLDFVSIRPDHTFEAAELKGELEKRAEQAERDDG